MLSMSDSHYISEKKKEAPFPIELLVGQAVTQDMTPVEKMIPLEGSIEALAETSGTAQKLTNPEIDFTQEKHRLGKMMRKKQTSAKIGQLLKQVKRNEVEIHEMSKSIESLNRRERIAVRSTQLLMKQLRLQLIQLRKQVTQIQLEFRRMRTAPASMIRIRKANVSGSKTTSKLSSKVGDTHAKSKSRKRTRLKTSLK